MAETVIVETQVCMYCGNKGKIEVSAAGLRKWQAGAMIQNALPELDASQRELLMTGIHAHCWETLWAEDEK